MSSYTPWHLPKGVKTYPHKNLHTNIYSSFIHNCQNLEATTMPFLGAWLNKQWCIQTIEFIVSPWIYYTDKNNTNRSGNFFICPIVSLDLVLSKLVNKAWVMYLLFSSIYSCQRANLIVSRHFKLGCAIQYRCHLTWSNSQGGKLQLLDYLYIKNYLALFSSEGDGVTRGSRNFILFPEPRV